MQTVHLVFYQRMIVWNMIGGQQARNMMEARALHSVLNKVRPTDAEITETQYLAQNGQVSWTLPSASYGTRDIELESEEARLLAQYLETWPGGVKVTDMEWLDPLIAQLTPQTAPANTPAPTPA